MKLSHIMSVSRISIELCEIRQKLGIQNAFADIVYNVSVVEKSCNKTKGFF